MVVKRATDQFVQSLAKGLAVIRAFGPDSRAMTLSEVARRVGLTRAAARRILLTLLQLSYVRFDGKHFSLAPRILDLGYSYLSSMDLWDLAQPVMEDIAKRLDETCSAAVLDGDDIVYVLRVPTRRLLASTLSIGSRLPAHVTSLGRVLLGGLSDTDLTTYLRRARLTSFTKRTVTDPALLRRIILADRKNGWSWVSGELDEGVCGIAVPIHDRQGAIIAAINISTTPARYTEALAVQRLLPELRSAAERIEATLRLRR